MKNSLVINSLLQLKGIGPQSVIEIVNNYSDFFLVMEDQNTVEILSQILANYSQLKKRLPYDYESIKQSYIKSLEIEEKCIRHKLTILTILDQNFPKTLLRIAEPAVILYTKGNTDLLDVKRAKIAIVGTREPSEYGVEIAYTVGKLAVDRDFVVVSGLAVGIDSYAHKGALTQMNSTIAILANGLDVIYPKRNQKLADQILEMGGLLISEYPPETSINLGFFVKRDRLQSALSNAVFVVETDVTGGTTNTVKYAIDQKKKLYCLKHPEEYNKHNKTKGNEMYIAQKIAHPVSGNDDLIKMFHNILKEKNEVI
jgi:DNA processing protein